MTVGVCLRPRFPWFEPETKADLHSSQSRTVWYPHRSWDRALVYPYTEIIGLNIGATGNQSRQYKAAFRSGAKKKVSHSGVTIGFGFPVLDKTARSYLGLSWIRSTCARCAKLRGVTWGRSFTLIRHRTERISRPRTIPSKRFLVGHRYICQGMPAVA